MAGKTKEKERGSASSDGHDEDYMVNLAGKKVKLTNLDKLYWPDEKITKGDLIYYYTNIHPFILPYLVNRPQNLKRNPSGIRDEGFFQKDAGDEAPAWVKSVAIHAESTGKDVDYIICNDQATLTYLNNLGCIELNPWNSTVKHLDKPDYLVLDIDPPDDDTFEQVVEIALAIKDVMDSMEAPCYCKTSGATGLHVYIPLGARYTYETVRPFAKAIAEYVAAQHQDIATTERSLSGRKGRVYVDYLQNSRGQTLAAPYSVRPVPGARVSTPLQWPELRHGVNPRDFTIRTVPKRLDKLGDLFEGVLKERIDLEKCLQVLERKEKRGTEKIGE